MQATTAAKEGKRKRWIVIGSVTLLLVAGFLLMPGVLGRLRAICPTRRPNNLLHQFLTGNLGYLGSTTRSCQKAQRRVIGIMRPLPKDFGLTFRTTPICHRLCSERRRAWSLRFCCTRRSIAGATSS